MDNLDQVSVSCSPLEMNPKEQVQNHENLSNKEQIERTVYLLHPTQSGIPESETNTHYRTSAGLISEENTSTFVPDISEPTPQPSVIQLATSSVADGSQIPELNFERKFAYWVMPLSATGIIGVLAGFPGNEMETLTHKILFKVYTWFTYATFIFGVSLFLLTRSRPNIRALVTIARFIMWLTLCSITYAIGFATCILLRSSTVVVAIVMVVPLVLLIVMVTLKF